MFERIFNMLKKEFIQLLRDPKMRPIILVMPIVQLVIFGYAANTDVRDVSLAVVDLDHTPRSRELVDRFVGSTYFHVVSRTDDEREITRLLDSSDAQVVLRINSGFGGAVDAGRSAPVQLLLDGTDSNSARIILTYAARIAADYSQMVNLQQAQRLTGPVNSPTMDFQYRTWFNENLESRLFYIPGVIAILLMISVLMLTSMAVVREKEIGTMEQVIVTPIRPVEFILGKSLPFMLVGYLDVVLISVVGVLWFGVPIRGPLSVLFLGTTLHLLTAVGTGLVISTIARTQQQALMTTFFINFPMILLSGFMFPIANMPQVVQWLTYANPMRYYIVTVRGIFLKGVGLDILWPEMIGLAILGTLALILAAKRFKKTAT